MSDAAALAYLHTFTDYERTPPTGTNPTTFYLPRMAALLAALGNPQQGLRTVVVAGTKGKGSTCAMLERVLREAGLRTGLWTSPHLHSFRERIQINRVLIPPAIFAQLVDQQLRPAVATFDDEHYGGLPTTFELAFGLALRYFADEQVELAVLEVGLGGRYDSANVITPLVSAISSISYDHMAVLGHTLAAIASEKAGIIKPGVPVVTVPQVAEAAAVIERTAHEQHSTLYVASETASGQLQLQQDTTASATIVPSALQLPHLGLRGAFQRQNACLAAAVALLLSQQGFAISDAAIVAGLQQADWLGRLELVAREPLLVLDGAHNGDSATQLVQALRVEWSFDRLVLVLGTLRDKDIAAIAAALVPAASTVVITHSASPRALNDLQELARIVAPHLRGELHSAPDVASAIETARSLAQPQDLICVTGSLSTVADARVALGLEAEE